MLTGSLYVHDDFGTQFQEMRCFLSFQGIIML